MLAATATDRDAGGGCGGMPVTTRHKKGTRDNTPSEGSTNTGETRIIRDERCRDSNNMHQKQTPTQHQQQVKKNAE